MRFKLTRKEMLLFLLPCVFLVGSGLYLQGREENPLQILSPLQRYNPLYKSPVSVTEIEFSPTVGRDLKTGYDTRIRLVLAIHGKPPEKANHRYAGGNIVCRNTRIVQVRAGIEFPVAEQTPRVLVSSGKTSSVSFFLNRARLPAGESFLRSTIVREYSYNTPAGGKFYHSPGLPVDIPLSLGAVLDKDR